VATLLVAGALPCPACDDPQPLVAPPPAIAGGPARPPGESTQPVFIAADFAKFYQTFLLYGLSPGEKTERWDRYYMQRWVRWCGVLLRLHNNTAVFRQFGGGSYDVVVALAKSQQTATAAQLTIGRFYNYSGRLLRYDDSFRITNLDQGVIFDAGPGGVPGVLADLPPLTRQVSPPPLVIP
jgi:hypothetical protein